VIDSIRRKPSLLSKEINNAGVSMSECVSMEKLACFRKRLAIEADSAIKTTLTHLLEKEIERCAIAIQKEIDRREA
jgi:hypothetical protein